MIRPPRSKKRFQGSTDNTTSLSNPYAEADGRRMRRRYACYTALLATVIALVVVLSTSSSSDSSSGSAPKAAKGSYNFDAKATITEIDGVTQIYTHKKSGMPILTVKPNDGTQDAVFGISFRTPAEDNSGTPYILQNVIQSGSKNYPIKDPFNQLARGSLQTHLETFTDKDRSVYTYASRNKVDFTNGVKVFLDGIFNPNFMDDEHQWIFRQEAWRIYTDDGTTVGLSGNSINEAKGRQMDPAIAHEDYVYQTIFQDHPYAFMEKGDWRQIVTLNRAKARDYYHRHYHPSNAQAFCYGPQDFIDECVNVMEPYLSKFDEDKKLHDETKIGWVKLDEISSMKDSVPYPSFEDVNDFRVAVSYVLNDQPMDDRTKMAWYVLAELLVGSTAAVIPRVITEYDLGDDLIGGLQSNLHQWVMTLGVSGVPSEEKVEEARVRLEQALIRVAEDGFEEDDLKGALNTVEIKFKEGGCTSEPRGVQMFKSVLSVWNYGDDPKKALLFAKSFNDLKMELEEDGQAILLQLLTAHIIDNSHRLVTEMFPSTALANTFAEQEQDWLDDLDSWLSKEEGLTLLREVQEMKDVQDTPDSQEQLDKISPIQISDLRSQNFEIQTKEYPNVFESGLMLLENDVPNSNGIAYVDFSVDISNMEFDDVVLLPLFCQLLIQGGNNLDDGLQLQRDINIRTGGLTVEPIVDEIVEIGEDGGYIVPSGQHMVSKILVRTKCVASTQCLPMFTLIREILFDSEPRNQAVAIEVLKKLIGDMEDDIQQDAHKYTTYRIQSQYGLPGFIREQWLGVTQLLNLRRTLAQAEDDWDTLALRLIKMADAMRRGHRNGQVLSVTGDKEAIKDIAPGLETFVKDELPLPTQKIPFVDFATETHPWYTRGSKLMEDEISVEGEQEAFIAPTRVNAVAKGGVLFDIGEPIRGYDVVVLQFIGGFFLYDELRFGEGASEAWAVLDVDTGSVVYQSDQDPNIKETLDIYEGGAGWVERQLGGKTELPVEAQSAIIGAIGQLDGSAMQPADVAYTALKQWLKKDTVAARQNFRSEILGATVDDFLTMVDRLGSWGKPSVAVVTNQVEFNKATEAGLELTTCDIYGTTCNN